MSRQSVNVTRRATSLSLLSTGEDLRHAESRRGQSFAQGRWLFTRSAESGRLGRLLFTLRARSKKRGAVEGVRDTETSLPSLPERQRTHGGCGRHGFDELRGGKRRFWVGVAFYRFRSTGSVLHMRRFFAQNDAKTRQNAQPKIATNPL
jgi:hypothetical protein